MSGPLRREGLVRQSRTRWEGAATVPLPGRVSLLICPEDGCAVLATREAKDAHDRYHDAMLAAGVQVRTAGEQLATARGRSIDDTLRDALAVAVYVEEALTTGDRPPALTPA